MPIKLITKKEALKKLNMSDASLSHFLTKHNIKIDRAIATYYSYQIDKIIAYQKSLVEAKKLKKEIKPKLKDFREKSQ